MNNPLDDISGEMLIALADQEASVPTSRVPCGGMLFTYMSIEEHKRAAEIIKGTALAQRMLKHGLHPTFVIFGEEYEPNKRCLEQIGNATEFLRQVEEYERQYKTPEQHARLHLLKVKVRVDQRAKQFRKDWKEKGRVIDHAAIKAHFEANYDAHLEERAFGPRLFAVHQANPFHRFIFGRAVWTYMSLEVAAQVDAVLTEEDRKTTPNEPWTSSNVTYVSYPSEELRYFPPMTLDRHQTLLDWLEEEWLFATDEQRELGRRLIAKVEEDGFKVHASLKELINKE